jgi:membrane-associated phospholipid phosphatase
MAILGAVSLTGGLALHFGMPGPGGDANTWRGGMLMDESFRDTIRLHAISDQEVARMISDATLFATMMQAQFIDALLVPLLQGDPDLAWQASFAHSLSLGLTLGIGEIVKFSVGRARPFERDCATDPQRAGCDDSDRYASFYSLHAGMAFTSAGFSCAMHISRHLYDDPVADIASCGASIALAATTGMLRIASDRHYLSDVVIGSLLGFAVGYLIPLAVIPERPRPQASPLAERDPNEEVHPEDEPPPVTPGLSWHFEPMLSTPSANLWRPIDGSVPDGTSSAGIGPMSGSAGGGGGFGSTLGISFSGSF